MKITADLLHHAGTDPKEKKKIEDEQEAWRTIDAMFGPKEKAYQKKLEDKDKEIEDKDKVLNDLTKQLEEYKRRLGEK